MSVTVRYYDFGSRTCLMSNQVLERVDGAIARLSCALRLWSKWSTMYPIYWWTHARGNWNTTSTVERLGSGVGGAVGEMGEIFSGLRSVATPAPQISDLSTQSIYSDSVQCLLTHLTAPWTSLAGILWDSSNTYSVYNVMISLIQVDTSFATTAVMCTPWAVQDILSEHWLSPIHDTLRMEPLICHMSDDMNTW